VAPVVLALGVIGAAVTVDYVAKKIKEHRKQVEEVVEYPEHVTVIIDGEVFDGEVTDIEWSSE